MRRMALALTFLALGACGTEQPAAPGGSPREFGGTPDLEVTQISGPSAGAPGQEVQVTVTIWNRGSGSGGWFGELIRLTADQGCTSNTEAPSKPLTTTGSLAAGRSMTVTRGVTIPVIAPGIYFWCVFLDPNDTQSNKNQLIGNQIVIK